MLNRFDKVAVVAVIATSFLLMPDAFEAAQLYLDFEAITGAGRILFLLGWLVATFGPIGLAVGLWRLSKRLRARWMLHLLFLPGAIGLLRTGQELMLAVIGHPDFDATLGGPVLQAYMLFMFAVAAYFAVVVSGALSARRRDARSGPLI